MSAGCGLAQRAVICSPGRKCERVEVGQGKKIEAIDGPFAFVTEDGVRFTDCLELLLRAWVVVYIGMVLLAQLYIA